MADDDLNRLLIESQNVLGTNVRVPFQGQGDLAASAAAGMPAPAGTGGGQAQGASKAAIPGTGGGLSLPDLQKLLSGLGGGVTRGDTGGVSLSDQLRSLSGLTGLGAGATAGTPGGTITANGVSLGGALSKGTTDPAAVNALFQQGFTGDEIQQILGGLEGVTSGAQGVAGAAPGTAEAVGGGLASGVGDAAAGAGALSAILGLIASQTGNKDLGTAASLVGDVAGVAGTAAAAPAAFAGAEAAAGGAAVGSAAAGGTSAIAGAGGLAFAPIVAMMLASTISGLVGGEDPVGEGIGEMMAGSPKYQSFVPSLMQNEGQQGQAFQTLAKALPLVQSKEELGQLLNTMKNYEGTTTGIGLEGLNNPYQVSAIPGTGPVTHGQQTPSIDWGPQTQQLQQVVDQLLTVLPGDKITATYGQPGGGLEGDAAMRLWSQFMDRAQTAPRYLPSDVASMQVQSGESVNTLPAASAGFYAPGQLPGMGDAVMNAALQYGQPGYDYAGSGYPAPGQFVGSISPYWQQLVGSAGTPGAAGAPTGMDSIAAAALATPPGDFAGGMLPEEQRKKLLA